METLVKNKKVDDAITDSQNYRKDVLRQLNLEGIEYDLKEWVTIKKYCELFQIKDIQIVQNWLSRGVIPGENIKVIEELNGLKLIKAVNYKAK